MADKPLVVYAGSYISARKRVIEIFKECGAKINNTAIWNYYIINEYDDVDAEDWMTYNRKDVDFIDARFLRNRRKKRV